MIKRLCNNAAFRAGTAVLVSVLCMLYVNILRQPDTESIAAMLLSLPEYNNMCETQIHGAYSKLSDLQIRECRIFESTDESAREFAVVLSSAADTKNVIEIFRQRIEELRKLHADNPTELERVNSFRIVNVDRFVTFTVYDTNATAENAVHKYFERHLDTF